MRDDPEYWDALSTRLVSEIRSRRASRLGWRVWAAPLATAAALAILIARASAPPTPVPAPSIAVMLGERGDQAPSIVGLLRGQP